jgi:hypothetical protein
LGTDLTIVVDFFVSLDTISLQVTISVVQGILIQLGEGDLVGPDEGGVWL